jgi:hypothetical protein
MRTLAQSDVAPAEFHPLKQEVPPEWRPSRRSVADTYAPDDVIFIAISAQRQRVIAAIEAEVLAASAALAEAEERLDSQIRAGLTAKNLVAEKKHLQRSQDAFHRSCRRQKLVRDGVIPHDLENL